MEKQQAAYFEALSATRADDAQALESFALQGVKNSVVEKYSDQAHFIYELLQNADDAKATSARFKLFNDKLVFTHNGTRYFFVSDPDTEYQDHSKGTLGDVNAITSVGGSNKTDEATIGKFGVGFKAVFQYTTTPHVYDPNVFFKIERFIVPVRLDTDYAGRKNDETVFVFPFDHDERSAEDAYSDISEKLRSLNYPLLFLSNLKEIAFEIDGRLGSYGKTVEETLNFDDITAEFIRLTRNDKESHDDLHNDRLWLLSRNDDMGRKYSVGFFVGTEGQLIPKSLSAFCFFPTKEVTELNFIVHAPFLLTESREGIRAGVQHNNDMVSLLSKLAADSLVCLKEIGLTKKVFLVNDNIFEIVPYDESRFTDLNSKNKISFKPFYVAIKEAFENKVIIPSTDGYVGSGDAYWADVPRIAELFSNPQLATLSGNSTAKWVFTSFGRNNTRDINKIKAEYIDSIIRAFLDEDDIIEGWQLEDDYENTYGISTQFIQAQPIKWLHNLYKWLSDTDHRTEISKTKPIFLNQQKRAVAAFDAQEQAILFLPTEGNSGYETLFSELLKNKTTQKFAKKLGITEPSLRDEIYNIILPQYKNNIALDTESHFKKFFQYYRESSQSEAKSFLSIIREYSFIWHQSKSSKNQYLGKAGDLYFPFEDLPSWFHPKPDTKFVTFDKYLKLVGETKKEELLNFFTDLGIRGVPRIVSRELSRQEAYEIQSNWPPSTRGQYWTEKCIDGCKELIETIVNKKNLELSSFVWSQLLKFVEYGYLKDNYGARDSVLYGRYQYFRYSSRSQRFDSTEAKWLRNQRWLANKAGEFLSANELTKQTINPQYAVSSDEAVELFRLLGIKEEDKKDQEATISSLAESLGLSDEEQRQAFLDYAKRKDASEPSTSNEEHEDKGPPKGESEEGVQDVGSIQRVVKEISKRVTTAPKQNIQPQENGQIDISADEDDYSKPTVDISKKIEKVKEQAEQKIKEIARLEDLQQQAQKANRYSYSWFKTLLEMESLNSGDSYANSREISISFSKVEREEGTSRTLILKHPNRFIPQSMEDLADIPLELHFPNQPMVKVAVEVVNVKSYTLRAKLRTNSKIEGIDLSLVTEARIEAKNPVFLIEELRKALIKLGDDNGYDDDFNMQKNLCENIEFVFGPPGTGKTTHLAENVVLPMMREEEDIKVLVLTPTNKAADVLVRRLMDSMGADHSYLDWLVRFGATNDNVIEKSGVFRDKTFDIRTLSRNVTVTTIARFPYDYFLPENTRLHLDTLKWDYIIFDEASMIPLANIVYPLYKKTPEKFIIAGDPLQIEPITTVDFWKNENIYKMVKLSSFTKPTTTPHPYPVQLLTRQYRSIPEIGEVFSKFAYGGILQHHRTSEDQRRLHIKDFIDARAINIIKFPVSKYESIYRPKRLQSKSAYHIYSALFAFEFVRHLASSVKLGEGEELLQIGLITPYRAQADLIDKLIAPVSLPNINVQVGTIHGFQGDECDIIVALFSPPPSISRSKEMFLNKLNIINVSISRAKDYLFVIMPDDDTENVDRLTLIKKVEALCKEQPAWSEEQSSTIEGLIFRSTTYLEDNSFSTSHQLVNIYGKPEKRYEIRSEDNAVDIQIHE